MLENESKALMNDGSRFGLVADRSPRSSSWASPFHSELVMRSNVECFQFRMSHHLYDCPIGDSFPLPLSFFGSAGFALTVFSMSLNSLFTLSIDLAFGIFPSSGVFCTFRSGRMYFPGGGSSAARFVLRCTTPDP